MKTCIDRHEEHELFISDNEKPYTYNNGERLGFSLECKNCLELYEIEIPLDDLIRICIENPSYILSKASDDDDK
jgi:hypothetical protein